MNPEEVPDTGHVAPTVPPLSPALDSDNAFRTLDAPAAPAPNLTETLYARAVAAAIELRADYNPFHTSDPLVQKALEEWCSSPTGKVTLGCVTDALLESLVTVGNPGPPAHDFRHMAIKDPGTALSICMELNVTPFQEAFLISTLAHDLGRIFEHHLTNDSLGKLPSECHGHLSFILLKNIMDRYPGIPTELSQDLLYAVLRHSALLPEPNFILQAVQQADRAHMLGPEGISRFLAYDVGMCDLPLHEQGVSPDSVLFTRHPESSFVSTIAFFVARLQPPTLGDSAQHFHELRACAATFLTLLHDDEAQKLIPEHELFKDLQLPELPRLDWDLIREKARQFSATVTDREPLKEILARVLTPPFSPDARSVNDYQDTSVFEVVWQQMEALPPALQDRFSLALTFQLQQREHFDRIDNAMIETALGRFTRTGGICERVAIFVHQALSGRYSG